MPISRAASGRSEPARTGRPEPSSGDRFRGAAPRIVEEWLDRVRARREVDGRDQETLLPSYRAYGRVLLERAAARMGGRDSDAALVPHVPIGRTVAAVRRSRSETWCVGEEIMLLLPVAMGGLPEHAGAAQDREIVCDEIGSGTAAVARVLEAMRDRLDRERAETWRSRVANLAHALQNSFGAADTASRLLARRAAAADPPGLEGISALIQSSIDEGLGTLEDVRLLMPPPTRGEPPEPWPLSLPVLIRDIVEDHEPTWDDSRVAIRVCGPPLSVMVDASRLRPVLSNLIANAVELHDLADAQPLVEVSATRSGPERAMVSVRDNGPGIEPDRLKDVFLPGVRGHMGDGRRAGLGLAVALEEAECLGGTLEVSSELGAGTTFRATFACLGDGDRA